MKIDVSNHVKRKYQKLLKKDRNISNKIDTTIARFKENPKHPSLRLHKLSGSKGQAWSISVTDDIRLIFVYSNDGIVVIDVGKHDDVY